MLNIFFLAPWNYFQSFVSGPSRSLILLASGGLPWGSQWHHFFLSPKKTPRPWAGTKEARRVRRSKQKAKSRAKPLMFFRKLSVKLPPPPRFIDKCELGRLCPNLQESTIPERGSQKVRRQDWLLWEETELQSRLEYMKGSSLIWTWKLDVMTFSFLKFALCKIQKQFPEQFKIFHYYFLRNSSHHQ